MFSINRFQGTVKDGKNKGNTRTFRWFRESARVCASRSYGLALFADIAERGEDGESV